MSEYCINCQTLINQIDNLKHDIWAEGEANKRNVQEIAKVAMKLVAAVTMLEKAQQYHNPTSTVWKAIQATLEEIKQ